MTIADANEPFATGLKNTIAAKGFKNNHVAANAGFTAQELSDMLNGRKLIKACDIAKLTDVLGVTANDIFSGGLEGGE